MAGRKQKNGTSPRTDLPGRLLWCAVFHTVSKKVDACIHRACTVLYVIWTHNDPSFVQTTQKQSEEIMMQHLQATGLSC